MQSDGANKQRSSLDHTTAGLWYGRGSQYFVASYALERSVEGEYLYADLAIVTCRALATEFYLKSLLTLAEVHIPKTHNLKTLFYLLPLNWRQRLGKAWQKNTENTRKRPGNKSMPFKMPHTLARALNQSALAFDNFRYDGRSPALWTLLSFPHQLRSLIHEYKPAWEHWVPVVGSSLDPDVGADPEEEARILHEIRRMKL